MREKEFDEKFKRMVQNWIEIDQVYLAAKAKRKDKRLFTVQLMDEIKVRARLLAKLLGIKI